MVLVLCFVLMKDNQYYIKDKIILAVFEYLEYGEEKFKLQAQEQLKLFAKHCVSIKITPKIELKQAFRQFIDNGKGYQVTINNLYHSL